MRRIEVVIDELVLRGVDPGAGARDGGGARGDGWRALAEAHDGPVRERAESSRRLEPLTAAPDRLGDAVADAVWGAIA